MSTEQLGGEDAVRQLPSALRRFIDYERFNLHRLDLFQKTADGADFDTNYLPQNCGAFALPCFRVARRHLYIYGRQGEDSGEVRLFGGDGPSDPVIFPVHPAALPQHRALLAQVRAEDASRDGLRIWAVPTSSTRTLLAWPEGAPEQAVFVKTSLYSPVFGDRRLHRRRVACSVGMSTLVQRAAPQLPSSLGYCWESVGYVPRLMPTGGVIIRSIPGAFRDDRLVVAPLFALLGGSAASLPLFLMMLRRNAVDARRFVEEVLCALFARIWLALTLSHGLILEAHAQDLLVTLSRDDLSFNSLFYRDFEGLQVDWDLRRRCGLSEHAALPNACAWYETYGTWGYPYGGLAFYKLMTSLDQYFSFVIQEFDRTVRRWQCEGLIGGATFTEDEISFLFSHHLTRAAAELYGTRIPAEQALHRSLKGFTLRLMRLRHELMRNP